MRSAAKLIAAGQLEAVLAAIEAYRTHVGIKQIEPAYRILPHNWFGQAARWREFEADTEVPSQGPYKPRRDTYEQALALARKRDLISIERHLYPATVKLAYLDLLATKESPSLEDIVARAVERAEGV